MSAATRWVRLADRQRRPLLLLCGLLASLGLVGTVRLYGNLRPDLAELLPTTSRSALDLATVTRRVGSYAEATVILHGADAGSLMLLADDLADELRKAPPELVRWVEYRVDAASDFYRRRLLLFLSLGELQQLRDTLAARLAWESRAGRGGAPGPPPDVEGLVTRLAGSREALLGRWPDGYFVGEVEGRRPGQRITILAMLVRVGGDAGDHGQVLRLDRFIKAAVARVDPGTYGPGVRVAQGGFVASSILEHDALAEDLLWATLLVVLAVAAAVALYNRTWKAVPAIGLPLLAGTFVTFGLAWVLVGHLNTNTAFLGSIVVGNGINVGLIFFARYLEARRHGAAPLPAMEVAVDRTWLATLTAAVAAGVAYASLLSTDFRGFNQFGLIGGMGMALSWLFAYLVTPPLVLEWERHGSLVTAGQPPARPVFTRAVAGVVEEAPRLILAVAALLAALAVGFVAHFLSDPLEYDFTRLRDQSALSEGAPGWWDARVDTLFGSHLTPTVLLGRDEADAREIARRLEAHRVATPGTTIGSVLSVAALVPEGQAEKLPLIRQIGALAARDGLAFLAPDRRMAVEAVLPPADLRPFTVHDLPVELRRQLTEADGRVGTPVLVYPAASMDVWNGRDVLRHAAELRSIPLTAAAVPMASGMLVFADVLESIRRDGPRATWISLAGVAALVLVAFGLGRGSRRSLADAGLVLAALGLGSLWFAGLAGAFHLRLNMLNFIALPITFGIGVDYAVNVMQRRRLDPGLSIADCVRTTGGAVALCSVTTVIGYSSLLVARNQALNSFGLLADLGELACLAAALLALPAFLRWLELRRERAGPGGA